MKALAKYQQEAFCPVCRSLIEVPLPEKVEDDVDIFARE
jgi:hypothetical protein